ncbi:MAG: hypothetical protein HY554_04355, partial [Elusimicrobia bacterium]|nr:hypothetical protein [Elusimicrobiota bacterium]
YTPRELQEMGIDGLWIGYEGTRSGFAKQQGRPAAEVFRELKDNGITILASMIVGFDYQDPQVVAEELDGLLELEPCLSQFLIYGPTPGTPFWERVQKEGRLRADFNADPELFARNADGFTAMVKHPKLEAREIERLQRWCFRQDFERLGPSIYRVVDRWLHGYRKLKDCPEPFLRAKAALYAKEIRKAYPSFLAGRLFGPSTEARRRAAALAAACYAELGAPTWRERAESVAALGAAAWTGLCLRLEWFQHPKTSRTCYRQPEEGWAHFRLWEGLPLRVRVAGLSLRVNLDHPQRHVWLRLEGALAAAQSHEVWERVKESLAQSRDRLVLDLGSLKAADGEVFRSLRETLSTHRERVRLVLPKLQHAHPELLLLAKIFQHSRDGFL